MIAEIEKAQNLAEAFFSYASAHPSKIAYSQALSTSVSEHIEWQRVLFRDVAARVCCVASYLKSLGVGKGTRVAIISNTRPEWMEADLAIVSLGAVSVSVYHSLTSSEFGYILYDSGAEIVFAENVEQVDKLRVLLASACVIPATEERPEQSVQVWLKKIISFEDAEQREGVTSWREVSAMKTEVMPATAISRDDLAALVYTSGTTGPPKGVLQTHGNHLANIRQALQAEMVNESSSLFLVLPLAHSFAKLMGYLGFLCGIELHFSAIADKRSSKPDALIVARDMRMSNATVVPLVPRLFEKIVEGIKKRSSESSISGMILKFVLQNAEKIYQTRRRGEKVEPADLLIWKFCGLVRRKIKRSVFGEAFQYAVSGGAKLPVPVSEFFEMLEIELLEGYGLTETCVATNVNRIGRKKLGSVGPVLAADIEIKLAEDGEVLFRGPNVSKGYLGRTAATKAAWDSEGWFRTGDLGSLDADGYLYITGRKKELIVTSGGKKVAPEVIEIKLKAHALISQVILAGDGKPYIVALVTLNRLALSGRAHNDPKIQEEIWHHFAAVNKELASFETVKKMHILAEDFTIENGILTPTLKVKRQVVYKRFAQVIEGMYGGSS